LLYPEIANGILNSPLDTFYDDSAINNCLKYMKEKLNE